MERASNIWVATDADGGGVRVVTRNSMGVSLLLWVADLQFFFFLRTFSVEVFAPSRGSDDLHACVLSTSWPELSPNWTRIFYGRHGENRKVLCPQSDCKLHCDVGKQSSSWQQCVYSNALRLPPSEAVRCRRKVGCNVCSQIWHSFNLFGHLQGADYTFSQQRRSLGKR